MTRRRFLPFLVLGLLPATLSAQLEPPGTGGEAALIQQFRLLGHTRRVLTIGAHPDDEDTELLTLLVRGSGAEAAYLSLNRGEGGQNLIGPELGEALGLLRTEELLAARRLDGGRQFFTRAYDFGFSKTLDDTWRHWPRDSVLKDVVRIIRRFRPQIVVSVFSGTPRDGHGQHQAAGWSATEAFRAAGDSARFPELLTEEGFAPWTPLKLYRSTRFDSAATTLTLDGGALDPAVGQSYHQIAMRGRSLHRSQDMGQDQRPGPSAVRLQLVTDRTGGGDALFGGVDTTLSGQASVRAMGADAAAQVAIAEREIAAGRAAFARGEREAAATRLQRALGALNGVAGSRQAPPEVADQIARLERALAILQGAVVDAVVSDSAVIPGETEALVASYWNAGHDTTQVTAVLRIEGESGAGSVPGPMHRVAPGALAVDTLPLRWPAQHPATPYFLREPRDGDLYRWPRDAMASFGLPFGPPPLGMQFVVGDAATGGPIRFTREAAYRYTDQAVGEVRVPVTIAPRIDVHLAPAAALWSSGSTRPFRYTVTLVHGGRDSTTGTVRLEVPAGWLAPAPQPFRFTAPGEQMVMTFVVRASAGLSPGRYPVRAVAVDQRGDAYRVGSVRVAYPHIVARTYTRPAEATLTRAPLVLPPLARVGYVRGAADRVPEALEMAGVPLTVLDAALLESGDLGRFDAIVIGPRAYETEPALTRANARLLAYVRAGGLVIVQYQQYLYFGGNFAPYPMAIANRQPGQVTSAAAVPSPAAAAPAVPVSLFGGHDRVTDEAAPVRIVDAASPVVRSPNRLTDQDWVGWVQERALYIPRTWDPAWHTVLETHDPGEAPLEGSLLLGRLGKGTYVYTGLSFFRQLPAGVPGAFRLFANLLALRTVPPSPGTAGRPE